MGVPKKLGPIQRMFAKRRAKKGIINPKKLRFVPAEELFVKKTGGRKKGAKRFWPDVTTKETRYDNNGNPMKEIKEIKGLLGKNQKTERDFEIGPNGKPREKKK